MSTPVTLTGRLTKTPELKISNSGSPITRFTVVTDRRQMNKQTNQWENVDATFWDCTAFGPLAEHVAESVDKGDLVIVVGRAKQETWQDKNTNQNRSAIRVIADEVAPSLRFATARITRAERDSGSGGAQQSAAQQSGGRQNQGGWGALQGGGQGQQSGWGGASEPPF